MRRRRSPGEYYPLVWDFGDPTAHYVTGHVTADEFRMAVDAYFGDSKRKPTIPADARFEHVYARSVRVENDDYGSRAHQWRHTTAGRGFPMTYWEIETNLNSGD